MTLNIKRLGALAAVQFGAFVIVVLVGTLGGPGHQAHSPSQVITHPTVSRPAPATTHSTAPATRATPATTQPASPSTPSTQPASPSTPATAKSTSPLSPPSPTGKVMP